MKQIPRTLLGVMLGAGFALTATVAHALPALQLGGSGSGWSYDTGTQTWVTSQNSFSLQALANAKGAEGGYAWDLAGELSQTAFLVVSAAPDIGNVDGFDISVTNASFAGSGYGAPPITDPNSLAPHDIFDTYFELFQFNFDGLAGLIGNTQPGDSGEGQGYTETFDITINSLATGVTGVHFDLFTMVGDGTLENNLNVKTFAPFSHDAESGVVPVPVPEPSTLLLLGLGLVGIGIRKRRIN